MSRNAREQSATLADAARHRLLRKRLTALIPGQYGDHKAAVYSSLTALFHNIPAKSVAEFIRNVKYPMDDPAVSST
jgi:hypothetical protein